MSNSTQLATLSKPKDEPAELLTCRVGEQWVAFRVSQVCEVVTEQPRTKMPLAPESVMGLINLRGKVMSQLDMRIVIGMERRTEGDGDFHIVIIETDDGEDFGLVVDGVGEVTSLITDDLEPTPKSLSAVWQQVSDGVLKQEGLVIVIVDVDRLLGLTLGGQDSSVVGLGYEEVSGTIH
ncbi:MAG: chemotaxis protein CheW [Mariprofundaceae bacterium]